MKINIAKCTDWKIKPLPEQIEKTVLDRIYSLKEFTAITIGIIPQAMEDKWFAYYEAPCLYIHRSWTGYCVFRVTFEFADDIVAVQKIEINRDPDQCSELGDATLAGILMDLWAKRDVRQDMLEYIRNRKLK